jgi:hypothetical protein
MGGRLVDLLGWEKDGAAHRNVCAKEINRVGESVDETDSCAALQLAEAAVLPRLRQSPRQRGAGQPE